jgi:glycosyltransferase involved in cell wall biosynthesis
MHKLQECYPDDVEVIFDKNPLGVDLSGGQYIPNWEFENMHWADVVMVNNISNFGGPYTARVVGKAKEFGKFVHFDTDDLLTDLYDEHRLYSVYKDKGLSDITKFIYSHSHMVTVTQNKFAQRILPFCSGVLAVIKNSIDYNLPCWNVPHNKTKRVKIGWAGGIHHDPDVKIFSSVPHLVNQKVGRENIQWDFYGHPPPKESGERDWQWDVWEGYRKQLLQGFKGAANWNVHVAMPPDKYGIMYANMDIAVAPLAMNEFNDSKSEIKVAEAGRYKIPLVASNVGCYNETIENWKTGVLIDPGASKSTWVKVLTRLIKDEQLRKTMGENLHQITEKYFDINKVVGERLEAYEKAFKMLGIDPRNNDVSTSSN